MPPVSRNVLANLIGGFWIAALTIVATPVQVLYLGVEGYGVIAFIMALQLVATVLDLGLSSTITRELAADRSFALADSRPLIRSALSLYCAAAIVVGSVLAVVAPTVSHRWFTPVSLSQDEIAYALQIAALFIALRWPVALYSGVLIGIQRMEVLNLVKGLVVTVRLLGGIGVLLVGGALWHFVIWFAITACLELAVFASVCAKVAPTLGWRPGLSLKALKRVWRFSLGVNGLAITAVLITQLDRVVITVTLPLENLGHYSVAYTAATAVSMVLAALSTALMPFYARCYVSEPVQLLMSRYIQGTRATLLATGLVMFPLVFFGNLLLTVWVGEGIADMASGPLALLALGMWLSASVSNAYNVSIAGRKTRMLLRVSIISLLLYAPILYVLIRQFGLVGAAAAWALLNASYLVVLVPLIHKAVFGKAALPWYVATITPAAALGLVCYGAAAFISSQYEPLAIKLIALGVATVTYAAVGSLFLRDGARAVTHSNLRDSVPAKESS